MVIQELLGQLVLRVLMVLKETQVTLAIQVHLVLAFLA
jgi:hypothetical protein